MTVEVLRTYRFRCDAAHCTVSALSETNDAPTSWTRVSSTSHQQHADLSWMKASAKRLRELSAQGVRSFGRFNLDLCPEHINALSGHQPQTDGVQTPRFHYTVVACSCGTRLGEVAEYTAKDRWLKHAAEAYGWTEGDR
ncbi:hypothetical protein ACWCPT_29760 [Streptomyces sp. NPDC002308]